MSQSTIAIAATDHGTADGRLRKVIESSRLQGICPASKMRKARTADIRTALIFRPRIDIEGSPLGCVSYQKPDGISCERIVVNYRERRDRSVRAISVSAAK